MTPLAFFGWCVAVALGGAFVIGCIGLALSFASYMLGSEIHWWRRK